MSEAKKFHIGDIISITSGRLVSPRHIEGIYDILGFLHGTSLCTHQLPRAMRDAEPWLRDSVPQFFAPEFEVMELGKLSLMLDTEAGKKEPMHLILGWLSKLSLTYGEEIELRPIPRAEELRRDPLKELEEMAPGKSVIVLANSEVQR